MPPTVLKNVLRFSGLAVGASSAIAHGCNYNGRALAPDNVWLNQAGFSVSVDRTNVSITRGPAAPSDVDAGVELWHSYEDAEPQGGIATSLLPFIMQGFGGTGPAGGAVAIAASTQTAATGTVVFAASNGLSFGMSGSSQITASMDAIRSVVGPGSTALGPTISFQNGNNVTFGINGNTITASVQTAGGTATGVGISAGTQLATTGAVVFADSNGISYGLNAQTFTASFQAIKTVVAAGGTITGGQVSFANSNSISFGIAGSTITASFQQPSVTKIVNFTATGGESDFNVTFAAVANTAYFVASQAAGVASIVAADLPVANRSLTAFRVIPTATLSAGDVYQFMLFNT